MVGVAVERFGQLNILHNNVGIGSRQGIREVTEDEWDRVMAVNLKSIVFSTQAAIPYMEQVWRRLDHQHRLDRGARALPRHPGLRTSKAASSASR